MQKKHIEDYDLGCNCKQKYANNCRYLINCTKVSNGMHRNDGILKLQKKGKSRQKHAKYNSMVNRKIEKNAQF